MLIALGAWWTLGGGEKHQSASAGQVGPELAVDKDTIDLGKEPFGKTVKAVFNVKNIGDAPLTLDASGPVQVLKGC